MSAATPPCATRAASPGLGLDWLELIPDGVLVVDGLGRVRDANSSMLALCGLSREQLVDQALAQLLPVEFRAGHELHLRHFFTAPRLRPMGRLSKLSLQRADGGLQPVDIALRLFEHGGETLALAVVRDISELRELHARIEYQAMHDALTGLHNRHVFNELLGQALAQLRRGECRLALLLVDLDDFKAVNDRLGHLAGDALLCELARRMQATLRGGDALARVGGDEFAVLLRDEAEPALVVADKLLHAIAQPWCSPSGDSLLPGASIGIALAPADGSDAETLLRHADLALYRAKQGGRGRWQRYEGSVGAPLSAAADAAPPKAAT